MFNVYSANNLLWLFVSSIAVLTQATVSEGSLAAEKIYIWSSVTGSIKKGNRKSEILLRDIEVCKTHP